MSFVKMMHSESTFYIAYDKCKVEVLYNVKERVV